MIWLLFWSVSIVVFSFISISADDVKKQVLDKIFNDHNNYRKQHHVPPLEWTDGELKKSARNLAHWLLENGLPMQPSDPPYGRNIWDGRGFIDEDVLTNKAANPVNSWYSEYQFYPDEPYENWCHFTQLIWKDSKYLACDYDQINEETRKQIWVVCCYEPKGNDLDNRHLNIFNVHGVPWVNASDANLVGSEEGSSEEGSSGSTPYWIYGLGFFILLIVILVAVFIYYKRKRTAGADAVAEETAQSE